MTLTRPWAIDAGFPNAADHRKQLATIYPREGVFPEPTTIAAAGIAYAGTGWAFNAREFVAVLKRGGTPYSKSYGAALCGNDGVVTGAWTIGGAPVSGSRIDLLCIRARDTTQGDSPTGTPNDGPAGAQRSGFPEFLVVAGVAAGSPARPAVPAGYFEIAQVTTPSAAVSAAGSTVLHTYKFAQVIGGEIYVRNQAEMDALTNPMPGDWAYRLDNGQIYEYRTTGIGAPSNGWYSRSPHTLRRVGDNSLVTGVMTPIIKTGRASGQTSGAGVLSYAFPEPFPNGCVAVNLQTYQTIPGNPTLLGGGTGMSANGFDTFWPGLASANVAVPYLAIGY